MNRQRLNLLIELLSDYSKRLKNHRFDMRYWFNEDYFACETTACALGTACMSPLFNQQGLAFSRNFTGGPAPGYEPSYKGKSYGYAAGAAFFELTYDESRFLFDPYGYEVPSHSLCRLMNCKLIQKPTEHDVIARIQYLIDYHDRMSPA